MRAAAARTTAPRSTGPATACSSHSREPPTPLLPPRRSSGRWPPSRGPTRRPTASESVSTRASPTSAPKAMSAWTSSSQRGSAPLRTASRSSSRVRPGTWPASEPLPGAIFRPLGHHRLKDVPAAAQIFQLVAPGLREDFPPLKTLTATSLPALHHRLVGRAERTRACRAASRRGCPPGHHHRSWRRREEPPRTRGGCCERRSTGPCTSSASRPLSTRSSCPARSRERSARASPGIGACSSRLRTACRAPERSSSSTTSSTSRQPPDTIAELLDRVPDLQILATSRAPLRLSTEHVLPLEPLSIETRPRFSSSLPRRAASCCTTSALASVHEICRRLDGLPLAIELVAARLALLPPAEILRALGKGLALEMEGPVDLPERQRTLRAAIDWSYGRLSPSQRALPERSPCSRTADRSTMRARSPGTGPEFLRDLEALVGWSLIRAESTDGELRLSMLRDGPRARARARSLRGATRRAAAASCRAVPRSSHSRQRASSPARSRRRGSTRLELEFDNLATALDWLLASGRAEDALRAISALERFWRAHGARQRSPALARRSD